MLEIPDSVVSLEPPHLDSVSSVILQIEDITISNELDQRSDHAVRVDLGNTDSELTVLS